MRVVKIIGYFNIRNQQSNFIYYSRCNFSTMLIIEQYIDTFSKTINQLIKGLTFAINLRHY